MNNENKKNLINSIEIIGEFSVQSTKFENFQIAENFIKYRFFFLTFPRELVNFTDMKAKNLKKVFSKNLAFLIKRHAYELNVIIKFNLISFFKKISEIYEANIVKYLDDIQIMKSTHNKEIEKMKKYFEKIIENLKLFRKMVKGFLNPK